MTFIPETAGLSWQWRFVPVKLMSPSAGAHTREISLPDCTHDVEGHTHTHTREISLSDCTHGIKGDTHQ
jgi:hypothetical protein